MAHPDLVPVCLEVFDARLGSRPNQLDTLRDDVTVGRSDLLDFAATPGEVTEAGLRTNVSVSLQYLGAWLSGLGAVGINNLMEDAATAEISRSQIWQWLRYGTALDSGEVVTTELVEKVLAQEHAALATTGRIPRLDEARSLFGKVALDDDFADFLTLPAYDLID